MGYDVLLRGALGDGARLQSGVDLFGEPGGSGSGPCLRRPAHDRDAETAQQLTTDLPPRPPPDRRRSPRDESDGEPVNAPARRLLHRLGVREVGANPSTGPAGADQRSDGPRQRALDSTVCRDDGS